MVNLLCANLILKDRLFSLPQENYFEAVSTDLYVCKKI